MMIGMGLLWSAVVVGVAWLIRADGAVSLDEYRERRDVLGDAAPLPPDVTASKSGRSSR